MILVLFRALKYMDGCLFLFPFGLDGVLSAARTTIASLASISGDTGDMENRLREMGKELSMVKHRESIRRAQ